MIVGLTGGIGSGKSTVAKMFSDLGIPVYIADDEAKTLMNTSPIIKEEIIKVFGNSSYSGNVLNKTLLANAVFNNEELLQKLNNIVHPEVKKHFENWYKNQRSPYVIKEAAILFENGGYKYCDVMITVIADTEIRIKRVMERDKTDRESVLVRIQHQWSDEKKTALSDYIIDNDDLQQTLLKVKKIHNELIKKKE